MANLSKLSLPLGSRFLPYDVELVMYYLKRKVTGRKFKLKRDIPDIALKNYSPSEIREMSYPKTKDLEGIFFCSLCSRYSKGKRKDRSGKGGFWKGTGNDIPIYNKSRTVGWRTTLTFYRGKGRGTRTDWHIHEYRLEDKELPIASNYQNEFVVLCKIFEKKSRGPKIDEEYESPVEEDADESSSIGPEEGQNTVATISTLDFENVDSVLDKSTREDVGTPEIFKNLGDIIGEREMNLLSPGLTEGFLEEEDLSKPKEDEEGYFRWEDFLIPMAGDGSNHGTSDCLLAANVTPVLPAHETVRMPKRARIKRKSSKNPAKKQRLSVDALLMIEDSLMKASASHTLAEEQPHEVDASNLDVAFSDVDDILIEDLISVSPGPEGYNTPPKVTCQTIIVTPSPAIIDSLIWRCKHIPKLRKIPDRFLDYQHPLPQTGYLLTEMEKELLMDFYKYFTHRKEELDMIISCVDSKSLRDLLDEGTWMDSTIIYFWFDVLRERCKDAYLADPSICSFWGKGLKTGDDMAFGPKGERVMDAMECKTLVYVLHAHNHWSLLVGYVDENRWEYYNSFKGEIWGQKTCDRFRLWLQQRFMDHGWLAPMMWTITTKTDIPFQDNGNDCGLFACAFAEHCIYRRPIKFTQSDIPYYRRRIVIDIFEQNWIRNASKLNLPPLPVLPPDLQ